MKRDDRSARHFLCLAYPAVVLCTALLGGAWTWTSFLLGGFIYPLFDLTPRKARNVVGEARYDQEWARSLKALPYAYALVQIVALGSILWLTSLGRYSGLEMLGLALSVGTMTGGIGLPVAHELIHANHRRVRAVGMLLLASVLYMHFRIEHVFGHHRWVGTPKDPATARRNESLWSFIPRSVVGQILSAWRIERRHAQKFGRMNKMVGYLLIQSVLLMLIYLLLGPASLALFLGQAAMAITFLEAVNYMEHYGLERQQIGDRYEPVARRHSWNTKSWLTNSLSFNLGLHSDHHANASKPFYTLQHTDEAPELPAGYLALLPLTTVPPLWRRVMNPILDRHLHLSRALSAPGVQINE